MAPQSFPEQVLGSRSVSWHEEINRPRVRARSDFDCISCEYQRQHHQQAWVLLAPARVSCKPALPPSAARSPALRPPAARLLPKGGG